MGCGGAGQQAFQTWNILSQASAPGSRSPRGWQARTPTLPFLGSVPYSLLRSLPWRCLRPPNSACSPACCPLEGPALLSPFVSAHWDSLPCTHGPWPDVSLMQTLENVPCACDCQQKCLISCCGSSIYPSALVLLALQNLLPSVNLAFPSCHCRRRAT